jgi:hypothetical protein
VRPVRDVRRRRPPITTTAPGAGVACRTGITPTGGTVPVASDEAVYIVAGGDMVAVFADQDSARVQRIVMTGANLDPTMWRLSPAQWATARARLRLVNPDIEIVDARLGRPDHRA